MCKLRLAFQDVLKSQCVHWNCSPLCLAFMWSLRWHLRFDSNSQCEHWKFLSMLCRQKDWENGRLIDYLNTRKYFPYLNGRSVKKQMIWNKWWNIRNMHPCPTHGTRLCLHRADTVHNVKSMGQLFVCLSVLMSVKWRAEGGSWTWTWTGARPVTGHKLSLFPRPLLKCRVTHAGSCTDSNIPEWSRLTRLTHSLFWIFLASFQNIVF